MAVVYEVVVSDSWVDINTVTTIAVGTAVEVMNKGSYKVFITEDASIPTEDEVGKLITSRSKNYAVVNVLTGSDRIWCRCSSGNGVILAVQEVV